MYEHHCQVCNLRIDTSGGPYSEGAHIQPLGSPHDGPDIAANILCLCPNHHVMFDCGPTFSAGQAAGLRGEKQILALYVEQRKGAYNGGTTATPIQSIRFLRPDVAIVNTRVRLSGLKGADGSPLPVRQSSQIIVVTKEAGRWLIAALRAIPEPQR